MYVVIFRATLRELDEEYSQVAARMRDLALKQFGFLEFHAATEVIREYRRPGPAS